MNTPNRNRLSDFIQAATRLMDDHDDNQRPPAGMKSLLADLVAQDDWLPEFCTVPHPTFYQQFLLHCDPMERFSLVSFVWGPGQQTPVHDHMVWGFIGMLRGAELSQRYRTNPDGSLTADGEPDRLEPGMIDVLLPSEGDIHQVFNAYDDKPSISIHLYGGNIGAVSRHVFDLASGQPKTFISGYSSDLIPNVWDRSASRKT